MTQPSSVFEKLGTSRRKAVRVSEQDLVRRGKVFRDGELPLLVEPTSDGVDLATWAERNRERSEDDLSTHGGILFRGFPLSQVEELQRAVRGISSELLDNMKVAHGREPFEGARQVLVAMAVPCSQDALGHADA